MNTSTIPENQKTDAARDLGQMSSKATPKGNTYPQWVVVEFSGTDRENVVIDFDTAREAYRFVERNYCEDEAFVDVMKRLPDGTLTTEF